MHKAMGPWEIGTGCSTLQHDSIFIHASSSIHKLSQTKWICGNEKKAKSITEHIACIDDMNKERVITTMKLVYWMVQEDLPLSKYEALCLFTMSLHTPNMPKNKEYTSYTNHMAAKEFLFAISQYLEELQTSKMLDSPFFSLMLDESTNRSLEKHLVVYATFLNSKDWVLQFHSF